MEFVQDYFSKSVGAVKKVMLTYGPNGRSRGTATIIFSKPGSAGQAARELNGVKVDNRPMKVRSLQATSCYSTLTSPRSKLLSEPQLCPLLLCRRVSVTALRKSLSCVPISRPFG